MDYLFISNERVWRYKGGWVNESSAKTYIGKWQSRRAEKLGKVYQRKITHYKFSDWQDIF